MKTIELTLYTLAELKAQHPAGYKRAHERHLATCHEIPWQDETLGSLKAVFKAAGVKLTNWSIGAYSPSFLRCDFPHDDVADFTGKRAMAWLENHLFGPLRIPWKCKSRWAVSRYGRDYRAGHVPPCPLTGYCADEEYLQSLRDDVRAGSTLKDAFRALADKAQDLLEADDEHARTEEYFDDCDDGEVKYTEEGEVYP